MSVYSEINRNPSDDERTKLAAMLLTGFGALGALQYWLRHKELVGEILWALAALLCLLALVPRLGKLVYVAWMGLGVTIGLFTQPIVLGLVYVIVFVPFGLVMRVMGRDAMRRTMTKKTDKGSYWEDYDESEDLGSYFTQY